MSNDQTGVAAGIVRLFEEAQREAATKANIERIITEAFASVDRLEPGATPEERAQQWDAIFEHMWRGFGCNVLPFPERTGSNSTTSLAGDAA
ncbi:hypothetical protein [Methylobacterium organophilum]|uniref:Uncharacterized protein n=1 Tax=Methylobacterium organophilum TaxID=410 RepID=A0ABQ4T6I5_METOR|nr:hypothetical protein [Methylobacterium organophilum]GJE27228.1 hypothetical protein LKMONMHP_2085 [Methylobacterium organophilum]